MSTNSYVQPKQSFTFSAYKLILRHASWKTIMKMLTSFEQTKLGSCVFCAPLDRHIGRHIDQQSTDVSVDISVECQPIMSIDISVECRSICRSRCVAWYIGPHIGQASVDMSTDTWPIWWLICRPRAVVRLSAGMSINRLPTFRRYFTATFVLVTVDIISPVG